MPTSLDDIARILGSDAQSLLSHTCQTIPRDRLHEPGSDFVERIFKASDRSDNVMKNLKRLFAHGRLGKTGYLSILPVDQGVEHSAGATFAANSEYFDPERIVTLAIEAECSAVASSLGILSMVATKYAESIPFILKLNHNELLTHPNSHEQIMFANVDQAYNMGAIGVGATIYFGSSDARKEIQEVASAFAYAHELGLFCVLWCYLRNPAFKVGERDYHEAADLTGQANYLGATLGADIIKQKLPTCNGGYKALNKEGAYGKFDERMYTELASDHPIDLCRYQVANCFMGRVGLINSGGSSGERDLEEAVRTAVINKRAGGTGLILGRKAFQRPRKEGIDILNAVQDVYLCKEIGLA